MKKYLLITLFLGSWALAFGQQENNFSQFYNNFQSYNSAAVGLNNRASTFVSFRRSMLGIDNGPNTGIFSFDTPLNSNPNSAVGLSFMGDQTLIWRRVSANAMYSHRIPFNVDETTVLRFGMNISVENFRDNTALLARYHVNDPILQTNYSTMLLNVGGGFLFNTEKFFIGGSVPKILKTKLNRNNELSNAFFQQHFYGTTGFVVGSENLSFRPSALIRYSSNTPLYLMGNLTVYYKNQIGGGVSFDAAKNLSLNFDTNVMPNLKLLYSYDLGSINTRSLNRGAHEIGIRFIFGDAEELINDKPRFTF